MRLALLIVGIWCGHGYGNTDGSEVFGEKLKFLNDRSRWQRLAPTFHISDPSYQSLIRSSWVHDRESEEAVDQMIMEGYFQMPPQQFNLPLIDMTRLMDRLSSMSLPVVFCLLYDEFWLPFIKMDNLLRKILGREYLRLPDFWAWRVDYTMEESGWPPHIDNKGELMDNGLPEALSMWIPLADTTVDNGCMYVLPAHMDPTYPSDMFNSLMSVHWTDFLEDFRALPATAGSVIAWNSKVWHYGSMSNRRAKNCRYALAMDFQTGAVPPKINGTMDPLLLPDFESRLTLVLTQLQNFRHRVAIREDLEGLVASASGKSQGAEVQHCIA